MRSMSSGGRRNRSGAVAMVDDVDVVAVKSNGRKVLIYLNQSSTTFTWLRDLHARLPALSPH
jgi:hypothetical protein